MMNKVKKVIERGNCKNITTSHPGGACPGPRSGSRNP